MLSLKSLIVDTARLYLPPLGGKKKIARRWKLLPGQPPILPLPASPQPAIYRSIILSFVS
jgi:hypothetical protein